MKEPILPRFTSLKYKKPKAGDHVWVEERLDDGLQPNGKIIKMNNHYEEASILYADGKTGTLSFDEIELGRREERASGIMWMIHKD